MFYKTPRLPIFCKNCGSKKVYWDKKIDSRGQPRWTLFDTLTHTPHYKNCYKGYEGKRIPIGKKEIQQNDGINPQVPDS